MNNYDATHDPDLKSWVASANETATDFPIQNLPFCMFSRPGETKRPGLAIGSQLLDLAAVTDFNFLELGFAGPLRECVGASLNPLMATVGEKATALRRRLSDILSVHNAPSEKIRGQIMVPQTEVAFHLPAAIGGFTDFFTSLYHTERGGRVSRPENPVPLNFRYMPIAYNSRASSVRISGEAVRRPLGQRRRDDGEVNFGPCDSLDFEMELGAFVGRGNEIGEPIGIGGAGGSIFGYCLVNDWSARDIQRWESAPLGPFLAKTLSTSVSPFIVTADALRPFRIAAAKRPEGDPALLPYLFDETDQANGGIDLAMEAFIQTERMRATGEPAIRVSRANFRDMYWTVAQMVAHHTSNGCNLCVGDLIGSGTVSGPTDDSRACLSEFFASSDQIELPNGETRQWLEDGDVLILRARAEREGFAPIGFGDCSGRIVPAIAIAQ